MSIDDQLMIRYYELLTSRNLDEIKSLHPMEAKKRLAEEIIERYYNRDAAIMAREEFERVFSCRKSIPTDIPSYTVAGDKRWLPHVLTVSGMTKSNAEAVRLIREKAVEIDGIKVTDSDMKLQVGREQIIKIGKRRFIKIFS